MSTRPETQSLRFGMALCLLCACSLLFGCAGDEASDDDADSASNAQPLQCTPNEPRACPCARTDAMGTQTCEPTGARYGLCMGCPPPVAAGTSGMAGAAGVSGGAAGTSMAGASAAGASAGSAGAQAAGASGMAGSGAPDASVDDERDASEPLPAADVEPGPSCGVGLVVQCAQDTEKCCARSLETDTCIDASAQCTCSLQGCTTMEAFCDGPEDCPDGQVCCGTLSGGTSYTQFACSASCDSRGSQRIACHQQEPECEGGLVCANSQLLTNVQVCIDPATIQQ